ncbi:MAG: hypothetical protein WCI74_10110 [Actinomycetes bacterium]
MPDSEGYMVGLTSHLEEPALAFATRARLMLRAPRLRPTFAQSFVRTSPDRLTSPAGFSDLALQDVRAAVDSGVFKTEDPRLALLATSGAIHAMMAGLLKDPKVGDQSCDDLVEMCLGMFGVPKQRVKKLAHTPLDPFDESDTLALH